MTSDMLYDGVQGSWKIPTARISLRFGVVYVGVQCVGSVLRYSRGRKIPERRLASGLA
jgi:hypothetical protein